MQFSSFSRNSIDMVSKTRDKLIEVARQLFAYKGVENTTMNDIAAASDKGRRTIYTYFKNKREIYNAVLERQSNAMLERLQSIVESDITPIEKLQTYLSNRFDIISESTHPKLDKYRSIFNRDMRRHEKVNRIAINKEKEMFTQLLNEGIESGDFDPEQARRAPFILSAALSSIDHWTSHNLFEHYDLSVEEARNSIIGFVISGITMNSTLNNQQ